MRAHAKRQKRAKAGESPSAIQPALCLLGCLCLFWTGCAGANNLATDPLLGKSAGVAATPKPGAPTGPNPVPPLPAPNAAGSTAALAGGLGATVDGRHNLQIEDPQPVAANQTWTGPATATGAVLQRPEPIPRQPPPPGSPGGYAPAAPTAGLVNGVRVQTIEQAQAQLTARGVTWQRLEAMPEPGKWKFTCSVPNPRNRTINRVYEAQAADGLEAMRAVLEQLDREKF